MPRLTNQQLRAIAAELSERERMILSSLKQLRYLKTDQVLRLHFRETDKTYHARLVNTLRTLRRLQAAGLISHLPRFIGGRRSGSQGLVWHNTEAGMRLLALGTELEEKRQRHHEPSQTFLCHTVAVAETFVQIFDLCTRGEGMGVTRLEMEPECWRGFMKDGRRLSLRPDLYAETFAGGYSDYWFIEMDLATESLGDIITKCRRYHDYLRTNVEQQRTGGWFPTVLWIVPNKDRKAKMIDAIKGVFGSRYHPIFLVITPEELEGCLRNGADQEALC